MPAYRVTEPSGSLGEIQLGVNGSFDSDSNFVFSQATKRLGLGTNDPQFNLHVVGDASLGDTRLVGLVASGSAVFNSGLSGSLTHLADGTSYLRAGSNITITTGSNGSVTISAVATGSFLAGADTQASYLLLFGTSSLPHNRSLQLGPGLLSTDGGAGGSYTLSVDDSTFASLSGAVFTGSVKSLSGLTGSLTQLSDGTPYLVAGDNVIIATGSNGSVTISAVVPEDADDDAHYLLLNGHSSLGNGRTLHLGHGLQSVDEGSGKKYTISIDDSVFPTLAGAAFSGVVSSQAGFSGSLTALADGTSYLVAGKDIAISTGSNGSVTISSNVVVPPAADDKASYLLLFGTSSLENNRALKWGGGFLPVDGGPKGDYTVSIDNSVVATLSGSRFTGAVTALGGLTGSLTQLPDGTPYLVAGENVGITTGSNGSVTISATNIPQPGADDSASYLLLFGTSSLGNGRSFDLGDGLIHEDAGPGNSYTVSIDDSVVAKLSGSTFTGVVTSLAGFSGSLTTLSDGSPFLVAGNNVSISTGSNGSVTISSDYVTPPAADIEASYLLLFGTSSLGSGRSLNLGIGLLSQDGGPGEDYSLSVDDSVVATLSGSTFTGAVKFQAGLTGSLTQLPDGTPYLQAGDNVSISTGSDGSVRISSTGGGIQQNVQQNIILTNLTRSRFQVTMTDRAEAGSLVEVPGADFSVTGFSPENTDVYVNGQLMVSGTADQTTVSSADYTVASNNALSFSFSLLRDDSLVIKYIAASLPTKNKYQLFVTEDYMPGTDIIVNDSIDYSRTNYEMQNVDVFVNGEMMTSGSFTDVTNHLADYALTSKKALTFSSKIYANDVITVVCQYTH